MATGFRGKLFRLLLLFALVPALVLTTVGLVAISDMGSMFSSGNASVESLTGYFNRRTFERLRQDLQETEDSSKPAGFADFRYSLHGGTVDSRGSGILLAPDVMAGLNEAASVQPEGFLEIDGHIYQYAAVLRSDTLEVAGIRHGEAYAAMMAALQEEIARRTGEEELRPRFGIFLAILFLALAGLTAILAFLLSRRIAARLSQPLQELSDAANAVADGDFTVRITPQGDTDVRQLITSFNQMGVQLQATTAALAASERVAAWRQVARRFAHELKNPLQPILISLYRIERLAMDTPVYEKIYEPLKATSDEVRHLKDLAERFAHLARLPAPQFDETDVASLLQRITALYVDREQASRVHLRIDNGPCLVRTDEAYLREAVHNLVQNALDATAAAGEVTVELDENDATVAIVVTDDGPGMDARTLGSARLPYFTTKQHGQGLGLAIVEKSVAELGGRLDIRSLPGQGTVATIILSRYQS